MNTETIRTTMTRAAVQERPAPAESATLRVSLITSPAGFDALQADWNDVLERSEARIFQTYEWQRTWWRHFGESHRRAQLFMIVVHEGEKVIGIAPLFIERVPVIGPLSYRRLSFVGRNTSDYLDLIVERGKEEVVFLQVAQILALLRSEFDVLLLEDIHDGSPSHRQLHAALVGAGFLGEPFLSEYCPRTMLGATWQDTVKSFPSAHRNRLVKRMKTVTEQFQTEFERVQEMHQVESAMSDFITMHQSRWNVVGHQGVFADETTNKFHRDVAPQLMRRGWLFLAFLRMNGKRFAGDYGLTFRTECCTYLGGAFDAGEVNRHSPGNVLLMTIMRECHDMGITVYDFLRGTERYKYTLGAINIANWTMLMFSRGGRTMPALHSARLLRDALVRRSVHEWSYLAHNARKSGVFSGEFVSYLTKRTTTILADAIQKTREPEKTLIMGREQK